MCDKICRWNEKNKTKNKMEKREIYILQKQQTKNFIFPVVIAYCLRTETFLIEYHKVDQSLNLLSGIKYIIII